MRRLRAWCVRLWSLLGKGRRDREFAEELASHLEMHCEDGMRAGMTAAEARRQALIKLGGVLPVEELYRDRRGVPWLETLGRDFGYAIRMMRRAPAFTATVVVTLGLGIGATTAIFSVVNAVLIRPLPYPEPHRLVHLAVSYGDRGSAIFAPTVDYAAWKNRSQTLSRIAGHLGFETNLTGGTEAERVKAGAATASLFPMLGVQPALGRTFLPEEDRPGGPPVAILSHAFWKSHFGESAAIVGKSLTLDGTPHTVVGVFPATFQIPDRYQADYDLWVPFAIGDNGRAKRPILQTIGRLKPGVSVEGARAELATLVRPPRSGKKITVVTEWQEQIASGARRSLLIFLCAVGFVLLVACVNVANLLLFRAAAREKEMAVRRALGAGRARILRQLLTESVLLALLGGVVGLGLASAGKNLLVTFIARNLPAMEPVHLDLRVLAFNVGLVLVTGIAFGLAPALQASRGELNDPLKDAGRGATDRRSRHRLRSLLVVFEVAVVMVLLSGAGLLFHSFLRLRGVDPGFQPDRILTLNVALTPSKYPTPREKTAFFQQVVEKVSTLPGVQAASASTSLPLAGYSMSISGLTVEGKPEAERQVLVSIVSPNYFRTVGIPTVRGRSFSDSDRGGSPVVAMVNESFARAFFPGEECVGKRIEQWKPKTGWVTIVGVVRAIRPAPEEQPSPELYFSYLQPEGAFLMGSNMYLAVRAAGNPKSLAAAVRADRGRILRMVLSNGMKLIGAGVAIGLLASAGLTRLIASELWGISATDPWTFAAVVMLLSATGLAACLLPARGAASVDPTRALREE
ncbi:MAG: ABC transporter permease [Candidatus Solibacter sp.]|nr:ABC transporter permease [Candidatus Solibacter sp.]